MSVKFRPLLSGFATLSGGIALIGLFSVTDPIIAYAQLASGILAIVTGIYLVLFVSWQHGERDNAGPPGLYTLIRRDIRGRSFRTIATGTAVAVMIGVLFATIVLTNGAANSIDSARTKLGADIIVVPQQNPISSQPFYTLVYAGGSYTINNGNVIVYSSPAYLNASLERQVENISGVKQVTPQLLVTYFHPSGGCGGLDITYIVGVDPVNNFILNSWLPNNVSQALQGNGVIAGGEAPQFYQLPKNGELYGVKLERQATLPRTGTFIDHMLFVSMDTANKMLQWQKAGNDPTLEGMQPLTFQEGQISAVFVKLNDRVDPNYIATKIQISVAGARAYNFDSLVKAANVQYPGLLSIFSISGTLVWGGALLLIGTVVSLAINERRGEIGLIRAFGASSHFVRRLAALQTLLIVSLAGLFGILGAWTILSVPLLYDYLILTFKIPYVAPPPYQMGMFVLLAVIITFVTAVAAALWPASVVSRKEAYEAMRQGAR